MKSKQIHNYSIPIPPTQTYQHNQYQNQYCQYPQQQRAGDWKCVICANINFAFRS